jgi:plastocyanin
VRKVLIGSIAAAVVLVGAPAGAGHIIEVQVQDNDFVPEVVTTQIYNGEGGPGIVGWIRAPGSNNRHNVAEEHRIFRSGDPTFGDIDFTRRFSAGTFDYLCEFHGPSMSGVIKARLLMTPDPDGLPFTVRWARQGPDPNTSSNTGNVFDVQYKVDDGQWRNWKTDTNTNKGVFGKNGNPVEVQAGHAYRFRARSQKNASTQNAHSRWSPVLVVPT